jgi:membrane-bound serine protease (ClpP class)
MAVIAQTDIAPHGRVLLQGELWDAVSDEVIKEGESAQVKAVDGLRLVVKRSK